MWPSADACLVASHHNPIHSTNLMTPLTAMSVLGAVVLVALASTPKQTARSCHTRMTKKAEASTETSYTGYASKNGPSAQSQSKAKKTGNNSLATDTVASPTFATTLHAVKQRWACLLAANRSVLASVVHLIHLAILGCNQRISSGDQRNCEWDRFLGVFFPTAS